MTHNEQFEILQNEYIKDHNSKTLEKMYLLIYELESNYIKDYCRKKHLIINDLDEKAEDATTWIIERYLKDPTFRIDKISAYAYFGFKKSMFKNYREEMKTMSYDSLISKVEKEDELYD